MGKYLNIPIINEKANLLHRLYKFDNNEHVAAVRIFSFATFTNKCSAVILCKTKKSNAVKTCSENCTWTAHKAPRSGNGFLSVLILADCVVHTSSGTSRNSMGLTPCSDRVCVLCILCMNDIVKSGRKLKKKQENVSNFHDKTYFTNALIIKCNVIFVCINIYVTI